MPIKRLLPLKGVSVLFAAAPFSIFNVVGFVPLPDSRRDERIRSLTDRPKHSECRPDVSKIVPESVWSVGPSTPKF
jgi:hypothetical protein